MSEMTVVVDYDPRHNYLVQMEVPDDDSVGLLRQVIERLIAFGSLYDVGTGGSIAFRLGSWGDGSANPLLATGSIGDVCTWLEAKLAEELTASA